MKNPLKTKQFSDMTEEELKTELKSAKINNKLFCFITIFQGFVTIFSMIFEIEFILMFALWALVIGVTGWSFIQLLNIETEINFRVILYRMNKLEKEGCAKNG